MTDHAIDDERLVTRWPQTYMCSMARRFALEQAMPRARVVLR